MRARPEVAIGMSTRNIMLLTGLAMVAVALPLGSEYIFGGHDRRFLPTSEALNNDLIMVWALFALDALIGLSYVAISATLVYLAWRARRDIPFLWMFVSFGAFIVACGFTHLVSLWTLWQPMYYLAGGVSFITAVASVSTAVVLPRLIPRALELIDNAKMAGKRKQELEQLNETLERQKAELMVLNKAKDEFISLASHQLRTPATGVKQYLGMVLEGYYGDIADGQDKPLQKAYESNERQIEIVNDLLKVASLDAGKVVLNKQHTDITKLVADVIGEQEAVFKQRKQKMSFTRPKTPVKAKIDAQRMRMVLENIISNASKYSPEGRPLRVVIDTTDKGVSIAVIDRGVGIRKEDMCNLFQKFSRLDNPLSNHVGGTGLGLYWAKEIIDLHGARLDVASRPDEGSTFTIHISNQSRNTTK